MKVLFVTKGFYDTSGGAETVSRDWIIHTSKEVKSFLLTDKPSFIRRQLTRSSTSLLFTGHPISFLDYAIRTTRKLRMLCKKIRPDLVHIHTYAGYVVIPPKIPTVVTLHDEPFISFRDELSSPISETMLCCTRESSLFLRKLMLDKKPSVQAGSSTIVELLGNRYPDIHTRIIPNPMPQVKIDSPSLTKRELMQNLNVPENSKIILTIGNVSYRKGYHKLVKTAKILKEKGNYHIFVVGKTPNILFSSYKRSLIRMSEKYNLDNFHLMGYVSRDLLQNLFFHSDLYVSASISEACNLAQLEAAAYKIPMVSTNVGAAGDLFGGESFIIPRNATAQEISKGILEMIDSAPPKYENVSRLNWNNAVRMLLDFYKEVLERHE